MTPFVWTLLLFFHASGRGLTNSVGVSVASVPNFIEQTECEQAGQAAAAAVKVDSEWRGLAWVCVRRTRLPGGY